MRDNILIKKLDLPKNDWRSILRGAGIAVAGAVVAYLSQHLAGADFGQYTYIIVPVLTIAVNIVRKIVLNQPDNVFSLSEKK